MRVLKSAEGNIHDLAFSPDGRAIAAAVSGHGIFLWNLDSAATVPVRLEGGGDYRLGGLRFSADGRQLTWLTIEGRRAYDRDTREAASETLPMFRTAMWWAQSDDGARAVSEHRMPDYSLVGWRFADGEWIRQWHVSTLELSVGSRALSPAGDLFAMLTRNTHGTRWWELPLRLEVRDATTGIVKETANYPYSHAGRLLFHPAKEQLVGTNGMTLLAWQLPASGDPRRVQSDNRKYLTSLAYHPSGRLLFVTSNDASVHVFDTQSLDRVTRYSWQLDKLSAVAVSPDSTLAAAGSANGDVVVWDLD